VQEKDRIRQRIKIVDRQNVDILRSGHASTDRPNANNRSHDAVLLARSQLLNSSNGGSDDGQDMKGSAFIINPSDNWNLNKSGSDTRIKNYEHKLEWPMSPGKGVPTGGNGYSPNPSESSDRLKSGHRSPPTLSNPRILSGQDPGGRDSSKNIGLISSINTRNLQSAGANPSMSGPNTNRLKHNKIVLTRSPQCSPGNTRELISSCFTNPLVRSPDERHLGHETRKYGKPLASGNERNIFNAYEDGYSPMARGIDGNKRDLHKSKY
jgi:hypothetical protein